MRKHTQSYVPPHPLPAWATQWHASSFMARSVGPRDGVASELRLWERTFKRSQVRLKQAKRLLVVSRTCTNSEQGQIILMHFKLRWALVLSSNQRAAREKETTGAREATDATCCHTRRKNRKKQDTSELPKAEPVGNTTARDRLSTPPAYIHKTKECQWTVRTVTLIICIHYPIHNPPNMLSSKFRQKFTQTPLNCATKVRTKTVLLKVQLRALTKTRDTG